MVGDPNSPVNCRFSETGPASMAYGGAGAWLKESWRSGVLRDLPRRPSGGQGWTDGQPVLAAVLLKVPGFGCAEDLERMAADLGFVARSGDTKRGFWGWDGSSWDATILVAGSGHFLRPVRRLFAQQAAWHGLRSITLDLDSTIIPSDKREALRPTAWRMGNVRGRRGINRRMRFARNWG